MSRMHIVTLATAVTILAGTAHAASPQDLMAHYATATKAADPAFAGFSAARGKIFHTQAFTGGKPATPACASCHGKDPRSSGRTPIGKTVDPMAISVTPSRYGDPAKVEKWFRRNCGEVLGRECTAREKGDWLAYMLSE